MEKEFNGDLKEDSKYYKHLLRRGEKLHRAVQAGPAKLEKAMIRMKHSHKLLKKTEKRLRRQRTKTVKYARKVASGIPLFVFLIISM